MKAPVATNRLNLAFATKEHEQRTEFGRELEQRMRLGLIHT
jgi:hypothetical protein